MFKILLLSRPRFWIYLLGPFLVGWAFTDKSILEGNALLFFALLYFTLPANAFLYGTNDFFDQDTDKSNPKKVIKEVKFHKKDSTLYLVSTLLGLVLSIPFFFLANFHAKIFLILFLLAGFFYSSPPLRFKSKPFLDFTSNILYALPGFFSYSLITSTLPQPIFFVSAFFWTSAMHLFSAIPDIAYDKKAGLNTTAVLFGKKYSLVVCTIFWLITALLVLPFDKFFLIALIYPLIPFLILAMNLNESKIYWFFPWINFFLGFLLFLYAAN